MSRLFLLISLVWAVVTPLKAEPALFTAMTYNIRGGLGGAHAERNPNEARGRDLDLGPVIAAIRSTKADVVALQEVVGEAQAREIATSLGMAYAYIRHGEKFGRWWGLAILSRYPIASDRSDQTSSGRGNTRRDLTAVVRIAGMEVTFVNVHVDKDLKDGAPIERTVLRLRSIKGPLIVLGDFNARPTTERIALMRERLMDVTDIATAKGASEARRHATFTRAAEPVKGARIDYIFADPEYLDVREVRLLDRKHWPASDHIGVIATVALKVQR